jgi:cardiolipin synthase
MNTNQIIAGSKSLLRLKLQLQHAKRCSSLKRFIVNKNVSTYIWKRFLSSSKDDDSKRDWKTDICTIPNIITTSRILASPFLTYAIINDMKVAALTGCIIFGLTDWLDGYLAKKLDQRTVLGAYLDPAADKCMITALTVGLMYKELIPLPLAGLILVRDVALIGCSVYLRLRDKPKDQAFFDVENTTFVIVPSMLSKINTGMQFVLLGSTLSHYAMSFPALVQLEPLWWGTAGTTLLSGLGYLDGSGLKFFKRNKNLSQETNSQESKGSDNKQEAEENKNSK